MITNLDNTFILFQQEGYLIRDTLCSGLTALRGTTPNQKGRYYNAFFNLSVGLERLLKIVFIFEHATRNSFRFPTNNDLKRFGHDISSLYRSAAKIGRAYPESAKHPFSDDSINLAIIECLSEFADESRYYNLDHLTERITTPNPLMAWDKVVEQVFFEDIPELRQRAVIGTSEAFGRSLESVMVAIATGLDGQTLALRKAFVAGAIARAVNPHILWRMIQILDPIKTLTWSLSSGLQMADKRRGAAIPYMVEFLSFICPEKKRVLRQRRWP